MDNEDITIKEILKSSKTIAIVGISKKEDRPSYQVASYLKSKGYTIIPVNPMYSEVLEEKCYPTLESIEKNIDIIDVFRRSEAIPDLVNSLVTVNPKVVWMQLGIVNEPSAKSLRDHGITVIMDKCIKIEYARLIG